MTTTALRFLPALLLCSIPALVAPSRAQLQEPLDEIARALSEAARARESMDGEAALKRTLEALELVIAALETTEERETLEPELNACLRACDLLMDFGLADLAERLTDVEPVLARLLPAENAELLFLRGMIAFLRRDLRAAQALVRREIAARERTLGPDHPSVLHARNNLAIALIMLQDPRAARDELDLVLAADPPPPDGLEILQKARLSMSVVLRVLGDLEGALHLQEEIVAVYEETLPPGHPLLFTARHSLALTLFVNGDLEAARKLVERVLEDAGARLPEGSMLLSTARQTMANLCLELGEIEEACRLYEQVLGTWEEQLDDLDPLLIMVRCNLGNALVRLGDLPRGRRLLERALADWQVVGPSDPSNLSLARNNLANALFVTGDLEGARRLFEQALAEHEALYDDGHPNLERLRNTLAATLLQGGEREDARELLERSLEGLLARQGPDHPMTATVRSNLALVLEELGEVDQAREQGEIALATAQEVFPPGHPEVARVRVVLAQVASSAGDLAAARRELERALEVYASLLPAEHPAVLAVRAELARNLLALGDVEAARGELPRLLEGLFPAVLGLALLAPREAGATSRSLEPAVAMAVHLAGSAGDELEREAFALVETRRALVAGSVAVGANEELAPLRRELAGVQEELSRVVATASADQGVEQIATAVGELVRARDRIERRMRETFAAQGDVPGTIRVAELAGALERDQAAVGFLRHAPPGAPDRLLAHVVRKDGVLERIDLGPAEPMEGLVHAWRAALGTPIERGVSADSDRGSEREAGDTLRAALLDPVLAAARGANVEPSTLFVCADDLVHLVPLEALPLGEGRVGDELILVNEPSFALRIAPRPRPPGEPSLLALGGPSFEASSDGTARSGSAPSSRSASMSEATFAPLLQTRLEAQTLGALFTETFGREPIVLTGEGATKQALLSAAPGVRYLHVATHGWFAQAALHGAGVRTAVTSLWKVDDAATRRLMELFYSNLWDERMTKARALAEARRALRDEGASPRDWAAWVLSGDPD